ncbi:plasmid mobilization protein, partial [Clostridium beijerinckii]
MGDRTRGKQIKFWADEKEFEQIKKKVEKSKLSQQDYLLKCALN